MFRCNMSVNTHGVPCPQRKNQHPQNESEILLSWLLSCVWCIKCSCVVCACVCVCMWGAGINFRCCIFSYYSPCFFCFVLFYFMPVNVCLHVFSTCMPSASGGQMQELAMVMSYSLVFGNQTLVLYKSFKTLNYWTITPPNHSITHLVSWDTISQWSDIHHIV